MRRKQIIGFLMVLLIFTFASCGTKDKNDNKVKNNNEKGDIDFKQASFESEQALQADLVYCDDEKLIFKDVYGLFVYSLKEEKVLNSLDVRYIHCDMNQGDDACMFRTYNNGSIIELFTANENSQRYYFDWVHGIVKTEYDLSDEKEDSRAYLSLINPNENNGLFRYSDLQAETSEGIVSLVCDTGKAEDVEYLIEKDGEEIKRGKIFGKEENTEVNNSIKNTGITTKYNITN